VKRVVELYLLAVALTSLNSAAPAAELFEMGLIAEAPKALVDTSKKVIMS